jgi:dTDP-4-amino-4,6-dideoxygalactose transaminase
MVNREDIVQELSSSEQRFGVREQAHDAPSPAKMTQLFRPSYHVEECLAEIRECLEIGWTGLGYKTVAFEDAWKQYTGLPYAHFLNSATAGLHLAVRVLKQRLGWSEGDEIISTPLTFVSTNHAVLYERLNVVFADVDEHLCLDPRDIERKITSRTRAVIFVGMGGNAGQYREVVELCRTYGLALILDAAHMTGTTVDGRQIGHDADVSVFSFQAVKNLPTADSGMVCFALPEDDAMARKLAWLGISLDTYTRSQAPGGYRWKYEVPEVGFKYHGNSLTAAVGLVQLRYVDIDNAYRRQIADWYDAVLNAVPGVELVKQAEYAVSARHLYQVLVENRDEVMLALNGRGIAPGVHYADNTNYSMYRYAQGTCPVASRASERLISLPMHLGLDEVQVNAIAASLMSIVAA